MLDTLEGMKAEHPELNDKDECEDVVRTYAQEKLMEAESEYMDCQANKNTARRYYAAASFLEVLATFHPEKTLDEATKKSSLFAKWRATEILKAIKEGRPPIPSDEELAKSRGLDLNDDDDDDGDDGAGADGADDDLDYLPPPAPTATPTYRSNRRDETSEEEEEEERPRLRPTRTSSSSRSNKPSRSGASGGSSRNRVPKYSSNLPETAKDDAMEYTRFALRALQLDDIEQAKEHLRSALHELE